MVGLMILVTTRSRRYHEVQHIQSAQQQKLHDYIEVSGSLLADDSAGASPFPKKKQRPCALHIQAET